MSREEFILKLLDHLYPYFKIGTHSLALLLGAGGMHLFHLTKNKGE
jgi:hypothetical protein